MRLQVSIPGRLPGLNEIIAAARTHWAASSQQKKRWTNTIALALPRGEPFGFPVAASFEWYEPNAKRDPDNIMAGQKFILDALILAGRLINDDQKHVVAITHRFHVDAENPRVELDIYEVNHKEKTECTTNP